MDITRTKKVTTYAAIRVETPVLSAEFSEHEARMLRRVARLTLLRPSPQIGDAEKLVLRQLVNRVTEAFDVMCIADCGCAGGQPSSSCTFIPSCPQCQP